MSRQIAHTNVTEEDYVMTDPIDDTAAEPTEAAEHQPPEPVEVGGTVVPEYETAPYATPDPDGGTGNDEAEVTDGEETSEADAGDEGDEAAPA